MLGTAGLTLATPALLSSLGATTGSLSSGLLSMLGMLGSSAISGASTVSGDLFSSRQNYNYSRKLSKNNFSNKLLYCRCKCSLLNEWLILLINAK